MTNCFVTPFRLKMHMILFLDRLLDVVCTYYCVARVTCLLSSNHNDNSSVDKPFLWQVPTRAMSERCLPVL